MIFTPQQFPALRVKNPKPWWPWQMGDPHLEHLSVSFLDQGAKPTSRASISAFARSLPS